MGAFNAARLAAAGVDVRLLARPAAGCVARTRRHMQDWRTGRRSVTPVDLVEAIEPAARYEVAVVIVRRNQVASVLALLAAAPRGPWCVFLGNNLAGSADMAAALGGDRVLTGMVDAGGERDGVVVRYLWTRRLPLLFGERTGNPPTHPGHGRNVLRRRPARAGGDRSRGLPEDPRGGAARLRWCPVQRRRRHPAAGPAPGSAAPLRHRLPRGVAYASGRWDGHQTCLDACGDVDPGRGRSRRACAGFSTPSWRWWVVRRTP